MIYHWRRWKKEIKEEEKEQRRYLAKKTKHSINTKKSKSSVSSSIDGKGDEDWFKIKLIKGYDYKFSVTSEGEEII